ncbi:MAG: hypothetical protein ACRCU1_18780 [Alsobacter sp.]
MASVGPPPVAGKERNWLDNNFEEYIDAMGSDLVERGWQNGKPDPTLPAYTVVHNEFTSARATLEEAVRVMLDRGPGARVYFDGHRPVVGWRKWRSPYDEGRTAVAVDPNYATNIERTAIKDALAADTPLAKAAATVVKGDPRYDAWTSATPRDRTNRPSRARRGAANMDAVFGMFALPFKMLQAAFAAPPALPRAAAPMTDGLRVVSEAVARAAVGPWRGMMPVEDAVKIGNRMVPRATADVLVPQVRAEIDAALGTPFADIARRAYDDDPAGYIKSQDLRAVVDALDLGGVPFAGTRPRVADIRRLENAVADQKIDAVAAALPKAGGMRGLADIMLQAVRHVSPEPVTGLLNRAAMPYAGRAGADLAAQGIRRVEDALARQVRDMISAGMSPEAALAHLAAGTVQTINASQLDVVKQAVRSLTGMDLYHQTKAGQRLDAAFAADPTLIQTLANNVTYSPNPLAEPGLRALAAAMVGTDVKRLASPAEASAEFMTHLMRKEQAGIVAHDVVQARLGTADPAVAAALRDYMTGANELLHTQTPAVQAKALQIWEQTGRPLYDVPAALDEVRDLAGALVNGGQVEAGSAVLNVVAQVAAESARRSSTTTTSAAVARGAFDLLKGIVSLNKKLMLMSPVPTGAVGYIGANWLGGPIVEYLQTGNWSRFRPLATVPMAQDLFRLRSGGRLTPGKAAQQIGGTTLGEIYDVALNLGLDRAAAPMTWAKFSTALGLNSVANGLMQRAWTAGDDMAGLAELSRKFDVVLRHLERGIPVEDAVARAVESHGDYRNMAQVERDILRHAILFYSYRRWEFLASLNALLTSPGRLVNSARVVDRAAKAVTQGEVEQLGAGTSEGADMGAVLWSGELGGDDPRYSGYVVGTAPIVPGASLVEFPQEIFGLAVPIVALASPGLGEHLSAAVGESRGGLSRYDLVAPTGLLELPGVGKTFMDTFAVGTRALLPGEPPERAAVGGEVYEIGASAAASPAHKDAARRAWAIVGPMLRNLDRTPAAAMRLDMMPGKPDADPTLPDWAPYGQLLNLKVKKTDTDEWAAAKAAWSQGKAQERRNQDQRADEREAR